MSKRQTEQDSFQKLPKKPKTNSIFRSAVSRVRVTPTVDEPSSSSTISRSTVATLSKNEDGRRRASGKYLNRQHITSTPPNDQVSDPNILAASGQEHHGPHPSDDISALITPEVDGLQNTTQSSKTKRQRNNTTSVSHHMFSII